MMIWFEEKIESKNKNECPFCQSKNVFGSGGYVNDISKVNFNSFKCVDCRGEWYHETDYKDRNKIKKS